MTKITEQMVRKKAEHNELEIFSLEELSLHQEDIERIEHLDKWCRDLKILYLQSNLIPKIENVSRLKKLEYINLALNNVEKIENLEGCESLKKLDLTVNFVGELTSIESLKDLVHFKELYLTGNPCVEFDGYKEYVLATLPQLERLDGYEIEKSERILALQNYEETKKKIIAQQEKYRLKRAKEKAEAEQEEEKNKQREEKKPGFDGRWYTDMNDGDGQKATKNGKGEESEEEFKKRDEKFWQEKVAFTPESRKAVHEHMKEVKKRDEKKEEAPKKERKYQTDDGRVLNVNESKLDFSLDDNNTSVILDLAVFKHMDSSLIDVDVQPTYVKVVTKGKVLQLVLPEEVNPDSSSAKRSQVTGHLLITMPKAKPILQAPDKSTTKIEDGKCNAKTDTTTPRTTHERLEVDSSKCSGPDFGNIVQKKNDKVTPPLGSRIFNTRKDLKPRANSEDFVDDPDVPPLM